MLKDRIKQALEAKEGATQADLARACNVKTPSVAGWFSGESKTMKSATAIRAAEFLGVNQLWLTEGKGPMNPWVVSAHLIPRDSSHLAQGVTVPIFDVGASMGHGSAVPQQEVVIGGMQLEPEWVHRNLPAISSPRNLSVISGHGDSMSPTFNDGDLLLVDRGITERPKSDVIYIFAWGDDLYIKRIQRHGPDGPLLIISDNPLYRPITVDNGQRDELRILGRVVWAWNGRKL